MVPDKTYIKKINFEIRNWRNELAKYNWVIFWDWNDGVFGCEICKDYQEAKRSFIRNKDPRYWTPTTKRAWEKHAAAVLKDPDAYTSPRDSFIKELFSSGSRKKVVQWA